MVYNLKIVQKKVKVNCNKNKTKFSENLNDIDIRNQNNSNSNSNNTSQFFEPFSNYKPNEIFEYKEKDNRIIPEDSNLVIESDDSSSDESVSSSPPPKPKPKPKKEKKNNVSKENNQFNEINTKINYLIDNLNNKSKDEETSNTLENNMHDIILFILFGVFVIAILEALYRLIVKLCRHQMFNSNI